MKKQLNTVFMECLKKSMFIFLPIAVVLTSAGCGSSPGAGQTAVSSEATTPVESAYFTGEATAPVESAYFTGDGGKGISLAILAPKAQGLAGAQNYIPALVQGEFVSNFTGYSAISVLDREHLDEQYAEILSGYYDDNAEANNDLGRLVPTEYILGGSIIKTASGYALQMRVTKTSDKTTLCSYSGTCTFAELDNLAGVRRTSLDLLGKMGIQLTARAQEELSGAAAAHEVQGQTALAQGLAAQRSGTVVEALSYYFQAASYDASLAEAASRVNILTADITSGNMGEDIRNDIQWRDQWRARLAEAEQVYANYVKQPRYFLVYNANLKHEETNYSNNTVSISGVTLDLLPDAAWFNTSVSVVRMVNVVRNGLLATKQAAKWGLDWPRNTVGNFPFGNRDQHFAVGVELVNSEGKTIGSEWITMWSGYEVVGMGGSIGGLMPRMKGIQNLRFRAVNAYDITTNLAVRIADIDGVNAETAAKTRGINILREAEYAQLPEVIAQSDSRAIARFMQEDIEITAGGVITGYKGAGGRLVIPPSIFGLPVTGIGRMAFMEVKVIAYEERVSVNDESVPDRMETRYREEYKGKGLRDVTIPNSVTSIGRFAFHSNQLTSVIIPNSVTSIGDFAFRNNQLTSVTIPNSVTSIGVGAFMDNRLTSITIPENIALSQWFNDASYDVAGGRGSEFQDGFLFFGNSFRSYYNKNGKKAGTYTRPKAWSRKWTYRP
jgi:hypothetical protein